MSCTRSTVGAERSQWISSAPEELWWGYTRLTLPDGNIYTQCPAHQHCHTAAGDRVWQKPRYEERGHYPGRGVQQLVCSDVCEMPGPTSHPVFWSIPWDVMKSNMKPMNRWSTSSRSDSCWCLPQFTDWMVSSNNETDLLFFFVPCRSTMPLCRYAMMKRQERLHLTHAEPSPSKELLSAVMDYKWNCHTIA